MAIDSPKEGFHASHVSFIPQTAGPTIIGKIPAQGVKGVLNKQRHIGTKSDTNTLASESSSKPITDCPENAASKLPTVTAKAHHCSRLGANQFIVVRFALSVSVLDRGKTLLDRIVV